MSTDAPAALDVRAAAASLPRVNLLPPEVAGQHRLRNVQRSLAVAGLATVAVVGLLYVDARHQVSQAQDHLNSAQAQASALQGKLASFTSVDRVYSQVAAAQAAYQQALEPDIDWSKYLDNLSLTVPNGVWLTQITATETAAGSTGTAGSVVPSGIGTVDFTGTAMSHDDVANWLDSLYRQSGYTFPYLTSSAENPPATAGGVPTYTFSSSVVLTKAALSGRADALPGS